MEFHEPLWGNAPYWVPADETAAGQLLAAVRHTACVQTCRIEDVGVNVKSTSGFVGQDEVAFPAIVATLLAKAARGEYRAKPRYLRVRDCDIEVIYTRPESVYSVRFPCPWNEKWQG